MVITLQLHIFLRTTIGSIVLFVYPLLLMTMLPDQSYALNYGPGIYQVPKIESSENHFVIRGAGSGVTVLYVPDGIVITGKDPRLSGFTLIGSNYGTGIVLKNTYRALVEDVEIQGYKLGLLSVCEFGHRQWLHTYRDLYIYEGLDGSAHSYDSTIRGVELIYKGAKSKDGRWKKDGGFSNTHTFFGGRIAVPGTPLLIDGPTATTLFGTYIDMQESPVRMTSRSTGLQLFGVHLDRGQHARKKKIPALVLESPKFNRVKIFGQHPGLLQQGLIVDGKGVSVSPRHIFISPENY